jgi:hypothetical protein
LKKIDNEAFSMNRIVEMDFSDCPPLDTIGSMAFYDNQISKIQTYHNVKSISYFGWGD